MYSDYVCCLCIVREGCNLIKAIKNIYNAIKGFFSFFSTFIIPKGKEAIDYAKICYTTADTICRTYLAGCPLVVAWVALSVLTVVVIKLVLGRQ